MRNRNRSLSVTAAMCAVALCTLPAHSAHSAVILVPSDQPTIQAAVDAAVSGDTIRVAPGTYAENVTITNISLTIESEGGSGSTTIAAADPQLPVVHITGTSGDTISIRGFSITGVDWSNYGAIQCDGTQLELIGNLLIGNRRAGLYVHNGGSITADSNSFMHNRGFSFASGIVCWDFGTANISRCIFYDNTGGSGNPGGGAAVTLLNGTSGSIHECFFSRNTTSYYGGIMAVTSVSIVNLFDNTVDASWGVSIHINGVDSAGVFNNIVSNSLDPSRPAIHVGSVTNGVFVDYNDAWNNSGGDYDGANGTPGPNSLLADPLFVGPIPPNFDLQAASPCIDMGIPDPAYNDPDGSRSDIGARRISFDFDMDGVDDASDNCAVTPNPLQENPDSDGDGICGNYDNCPNVWNVDQRDLDKDGIGDACDPCVNDYNNDWDNDGYCADVDNCPDAFNPDQADSNSDGRGNACECLCPFAGDLDASGAIDASDLNRSIDVFFFNAPDPRDPVCPITRTDWNANGQSNSTDLGFIIKYLFFNGPEPCDPCNPQFPSCLY